MKVPDLDDKGWFWHSYLLETTSKRCKNCQSSSLSNKLWKVKAHLTYTPSTNATHRQAVPADSSLDPRLAIFQLTQESEIQICDACYEPDLHASGKTLVQSSPQGWAEAIKQDALAVQRKVKPPTQSELRAREAAALFEEL